MEAVSQYIVNGLLVTPILAAIIMLFFKDGVARKVFVYAFAAIIAVGSIVLCAINIGAPYTLVSMSEEFAHGMHYVGIAASIVIALTILGFAIKYKNVIAIVLAIVQLAGSLYVEFAIAPGCEVTENLYFDSFTLLMVFIIGVIGSGICVYALGYMKDHNKHLKPGEKDRSNRFFALMFLFLSAMFMIVVSNNMIWMFTGWEITTLCSFLLIGYTKTHEAIRNSFRQINMNLLGGIAFAGALYLSATQFQTLSFNGFLSGGLQNPSLVALPLCLLAFAGITKAAQMPFHTWLLGAMVAPTPTSALLHSSTMVKAGVFLLVKLAPLFYNVSMTQNPIEAAPAIMVMLVGGVTFLVCSFLAISQSNAKRVLAYSTIANLGLITACAGVGSPFAIWAAMFLILFHACAKSLLFLCVGTAEHHIGSRNIEDMDALFVRMPRLARLMLVGMMAMFIAPFGMLISKWAALVSFINANQIALILILAFGSAATFMFWAKWIGKLTGIIASKDNVEKTVHKSEWISQITMIVLVVLCVATLPLLSDFVVTPYITSAFSVFGYQVLYYLYSGGFLSSPISMDCIYVCIISLIIIALVLFLRVGKSNKFKQVNIYLAGASLNDDKRTYKGSMNKEVEASAKNWYLESIFGEARLSPVGSVLNIVLFVMAAAASVFLLLQALSVMA